jgi:PAS domain S-box-containing protein
MEALGFCLGSLGNRIFQESQGKAHMHALNEVAHGIFFESAPHGIVIQDAAGKIIAANPAAQRLLGLSMDQMLDRISLVPRWQAFREDGTPFLDEDHPAMQALRTRLPVESTVMGVFNPLDGVSTWIHVSAMPVFKPGEDVPCRVVSTFVDFSIQKKAEERLQAIRDRFLALADRIPGYIAQVNAYTLRYEFVNEAYERAFGMPRDKILGSHVKEVIGEDSFLFARQFIDQVKAGRAISYEREFQFPSGPRWLEVTYSPLLGSAGNVESIAVLNFDITERKHAEAALAHSEVLQRVILDSLQANVATLDPAGNIISVNEPWRCFAQENGVLHPFGVTENLNYLEVVRKSAEAGDASAREAFKGLEEVLGGTKHTFEMDYPCHSPIQQRWFRMKVTNFEGPLGGAVVVHENITERKQAEISLKEANRRLDTLMEAVPGVVYQFLVAPDGGWSFLHLSKGIEQLYEVAAEAAIRDHQALTMLILPEDRDSHREAVAKAVQELSLWDHEHRIRTPSGKLKWVRGIAKPQPLDDGGMLWNGILVDVTQRKETELALVDAEANHMALIKAIPDLIFRLHRDGTYLAVEASDPSLLLVPPETFLHRKIEDVLPRSLADQFSESISRALDQEAVQVLNYSLSIGGKDVFFESRISPCTRDTVVIISRDLTEFRRMEAEKVEAEAKNRRLQKAESLGLMAGSIAHHFNNKLQSVMAGLEAIDLLPKGADPAKFVAIAKQATERAAEISRLLLVYLGQTAGVREPRFLTDLCRDTLAELPKPLSETVSLEMDFAPPGPVINANADLMHQILAHLLTNAREALGQAPESIRLHLGTCPPEDIPTRHRFPVDWQPQGADLAFLEVADTGCGIAEAVIEKLFDPFFSTKFPGRGLGLPVVLGVVQAQGGGITVESRPRQGSTFRIFFPISTEVVPQPPEPGVSASVPPDGGTILLVDDDEMLLATTPAMIMALGFAVLTAKDGHEAVEVFRQHRAGIRCVITDLTMPRMDGWETLAALRELDPALPVILASGYDRAQVLSSSHPDRPQAFLSKPFDVRQLRDALGQALLHESGPAPH